MILHWAIDARWAKVLYRIHPLSTQVTTTARVSLANTVDALRALLENPRLNPQGHLFNDRLGESLVVAFSPKAWF